MRKMHGIDKFDRELLQRVVDNPGISIIELIKPFLKDWSEPGLRARVRRLEVDGFIKYWPAAHFMYCYPTETTAAACAGVSKGGEAGLG